METKKSSKANLEKDISLNFLMGIVVGLAILFVGFEWGEKDIEVATSSGVADIIIEEEIDATIQEEEPPPPPPEPEIPKEMDIITVVEDQMEVESIDFTSEDDASHAQVEVFTPSQGIVEEEEEMDENHVWEYVDKMPEFPGGKDVLTKWIADNTNYPQIAIENGYTGVVYCSFVVNTDGSVVDVTVARGSHIYLDREALRVLNMLPKFIPGEQMGKPVRVKYSVPVRFSLSQQR